MRKDFLEAIQSRVARIAVGPSTVRGRGNKGAVSAAQEFLRKLNLQPFAAADARAFRVALDRSTDQLTKAFPVKAQSWGLARKVLNIFLRDALYTSYLRDAYGLGQAEAYYELPLDSITAGQLKRAVGRGRLSPWPGVKYVTSELSDEYQDAAQQVAQGYEIHRAHLDAYWWSVSRDKLIKNKK